LWPTTIIYIIINISSHGYVMGIIGSGHSCGAAPMRAKCERPHGALAAARTRNARALAAARKEGMAKTSACKEGMAKESTRKEGMAKESD
jgi:hypothetical protein